MGGGYVGDIEWARGWGVGVGGRGWGSACGWVWAGAGKWPSQAPRPKSFPSEERRMPSIPRRFPQRWRFGGERPWKPQSARFDGERDCPAPPAPQTLASPGLAPHGLAPQGLSQQGLVPHGLAQLGLAPHGMAQQGLPPQGLASQEHQVLVLQRAETAGHRAPRLSQLGRNRVMPHVCGCETPAQLGARLMAARVPRVCQVGPCPRVRRTRWPRPSQHGSRRDAHPRFPIRWGGGQKLQHLGQNRRGALGPKRQISLAGVGWRRRLETSGPLGA